MHESPNKSKNSTLFNMKNERISGSKLSDILHESNNSERNYHGNFYSILNNCGNSNDPLIPSHHYTFSNSQTHTKYYPNIKSRLSQKSHSNNTIPLDTNSGIRRSLQIENFNNLCEISHNQYNSQRSETNFSTSLVSSLIDEHFLTNDEVLMEMLENSQPKSSSFFDISDTQCVICSDMIEQSKEIGYLEDCKHYFCFECIKKWANITNLCPLCKNEFFFIKKVFKTGNNFLYSELVNVSPKLINQMDPIDVENQENDGGCEICGIDNEWPNLLLCDCCDKLYHTYCLNPPLNSVPLGTWFCPCCTRIFNNSSSSRYNHNNRNKNVTSKTSTSLEQSQHYQPSNRITENSCSSSDRTRRVRNFKQCMTDNSILQLLDNENNHQKVITHNIINSPLRSKSHQNLRHTSTNKAIKRENGRKLRKRRKFRISSSSSSPERTIGYN